MSWRDHVRATGRHVWRHSWRLLFIIIAVFAVVVGSLVLVPLGTHGPKQQQTVEQAAPAKVQPAPTTQASSTKADESASHTWESLTNWQKGAVHWTPKEWLVFACFALAFIVGAHVVAPNHHYAWVATLVVVGVAIYLSPPLTSSSPTGDSWEAVVVETATNLARAIADMDPLYKLILCGILAMALLLPFVYSSYQSRAYKPVSIGMFVLGLVAPLLIFWWAFSVGPGAVLAVDGVITASAQRKCALPKTTYHFLTKEPGRAFNPAGRCGPDLWTYGHCIMVRSPGAEPVKRCPGDTLPDDTMSVWSAGDEFVGAVGLSQPRYTKKAER